MEITVRELRERLNDNEEIILLDVREEKDYDNYNLEGINIPAFDLIARLDEIKEWKEHEIVELSNHGNSGKKSQMMLTIKGFQNIRNLVSGIRLWQDFEF